MIKLNIPAPQINHVQMARAEYLLAKPYLTNLICCDTDEVVEAIKHEKVHNVAIARLAKGNNIKKAFAVDKIPHSATDVASQPTIPKTLQEAARTPDAFHTTNHQQPRKPETSIISVRRRACLPILVK